VCQDSWASLYPTEFRATTITLAVLEGLLFALAVAFLLERVLVRKERRATVNTLGLAFASISLMFGCLFWAISPWGIDYSSSVPAMVALNMTVSLENVFLGWGYAVCAGALLAIVVTKSGQFSWSLWPNVLVLAACGIATCAIIVLTVIAYYSPIAAFRLSNFGVLAAFALLCGVILMTGGLIVLRRLRQFRDGRAQMEIQFYTRIIQAGIALILTLMALTGIAVVHSLVPTGSPTYFWVHVGTGFAKLPVTLILLFMYKYRSLETGFQGRPTPTTEVLSAEPTTQTSAASIEPLLSTDSQAEPDYDSSNEIL
jgi:hypothetical protein